MALFLPSNTCASLYRSPKPCRKGFTSTSSNSRLSSLKCLRRKTVSELRTAVDVGSQTREDGESIPSHKVTVHDRQRGVVHEFFVPEDQYILHTAESQNLTLPFACRHGCCTSCAVRVKSGEIRQPGALGISAELKSKGYALLCVGFPTSDLEVETQDEDEVVYCYIIGNAKLNIEG